MESKQWARSGSQFLTETILHSILALFILLLPSCVARAQEPPESAPPAQNNPLVVPASTRVGVPLEDLLREADENNPQIRAAKQAWDSSRHDASGEGSGVRTHDCRSCQQGHTSA